MSKDRQPRSFYEFGPFVIDEVRRRVLRGGETVPLTKKEFETLLVLVRGGGRVIEKDQLMAAVWADTHVEEGNLAVHVSKLRSKLGRCADGTPYIATETGRGYRFTAPVREVEDFDLVIRKHTRSHIVTHETEVTDASETQADSTPVVNNIRTRRLSTGGNIFNRQGHSSRGPLAFAGVLALVSVVLFGAFIYRRHNATQPATTGASVHSIAIVPLRALSAPAEDSYLGLGIADNLVTRLGNQRRIIVRPVSAVAKYDGQEVDAVAIGRELQVDAVLSGNFQRSGDRVRAFVQLVSVSDGAILWARTFDEKLTDTLAMQDAIAKETASALVSNLSASERQQLVKRPTENAEAYQLYLKGRYLWNKRGDNLTKAIEYFQRAIVLDPNFALAYVGLADCYGMHAWPATQAEAAVRRALALDDTLAEAHASLGFIKMFHHWDWAGAEAEFRCAIELNPNYAPAHEWSGTSLALQRRFPEAEQELQLALALDPSSLPINGDICELRFFEHNYGAAINQCRKTLELDPAFINAKVTLSEIYFQQGTDGAPMDEYFEFNALPKDGRYVKDFNAAGIKGLLRAQLADVLKQPGTSAAAEPVVRRLVQLGENDEALRRLRESYEQHNFMLPFINVEPAYDGLRSDPRFMDIVRQIGLAQ